MSEVPSRYQPLIDFLLACDGGEVELSLAEIEALVGQRITIVFPGEKGRPAATHNIAGHVSTRLVHELQEELAFLRERLHAAERENAELRQLLNVEQQNIARLLPAADGSLGALEPPPASWAVDAEPFVWPSADTALSLERAGSLEETGQSVAEAEKVPSAMMPELDEPEAGEGAVRISARSRTLENSNTAPAGVREATTASARPRPSWFRRVFFGEG